ncbi:MAG TPA: pyrroline-5-carboxylate reductase dimerization domain-containing protein [Thermoleophilaceae bacterium]|jgi:pyrroline-5-carboxylate reductase|nr:pyrroline-5-carboxylate reductase dimerization domain-containing protein [Thermoleophilaceae bacterium]
MRLGFIGAGNMASALARGIGEPALVADIDARKADALAAALGGEAVGSNAELAERAEAVVLCHKPKQLEEVAAEVAGHTDVVVSILAATGTGALASAYPGAAIYRFIPNMPVEVRRGVLCYVRGPGAAEGPEAEILELMGRTGTVIGLDPEPLIEPAMALMSCGPAFMALVAEAFAEAGAAHGLDPAAAMRMVVETMGGTAGWLAEHGYDGPELRARVATPGGATERGLERLEAEGLHELARATVDAVVEKAGA